jgi:hypothetical protein
MSGHLILFMTSFLTLFIAECEEENVMLSIVSLLNKFLDVCDPKAL